MPVFPTADYRLHYQWGAEFDPRRGTVVLLHDGLGAVGSWRGLPQLLSEALQVNTLVYDRWGYGQSEPRAVFQSRFMEAEVPVLAALLAHLGVERPCLLGHSDGGSIALLFAAWHPEQVTAVITEAAHTFVEPETQAGIRDLVALQAAGSTPRWLHKLHGPRAESLLRAWSAHWLSDVHARWDIRGELHGVHCPVLAIQGDADEFGTQAQVDSILSRVAGAERWIVPECGHTPHTEVESAFLARVCAFLERHLPAPGARGAARADAHGAAASEDAD